MISNIELGHDLDVTAILPLTEDDLVQWLRSQPDTTTAWCQRYEFSARSGKFLVIPGKNGKLEKVLYGLGKAGDKVSDYWHFGTLAKQLPAGTYSVDIDFIFCD